MLLGQRLSNKKCYSENRDCTDGLIWGATDLSESGFITFICLVLILISLGNLFCFLLIYLCAFVCRLSLVILKADCCLIRF